MSEWWYWGALAVVVLFGLLIRYAPVEEDPDKVTLTEAVEFAITVGPALVRLADALKNFNEPVEPPRPPPRDVTPRSSGQTPDSAQSEVKPRLLTARSPSDESSTTTGSVP